MKRIWRAAWVISAVSLALTVAWQLMWQIGFGMPGLANLYLHQRKYESVIYRAKELRVAPGETRRSKIDGYETWITCDERGHCLITIMTIDWDHGGSYGYTYSDAVLSTVPDGMYSSEETLPGSKSGLMFVNRQINAHWWSVYNDLN